MRRAQHFVSRTSVLQTPTRRFFTTNISKAMTITLPAHRSCYKSTQNAYVTKFHEHILFFQSGAPTTDKSAESF